MLWIDSKADTNALRSRLKTPLMAVHLEASAQEAIRSASTRELVYRPAWAVPNAPHVKREPVKHTDSLNQIKHKPSTQTLAADRLNTQMPDRASVKLEKAIPHRTVTPEQARSTSEKTPPASNRTAQRDSEKVTVKEWGPSRWGRLLTASADWLLRLENLELSLTLDGRSYLINFENEATYRIHPGTYWTDFTHYPEKGKKIKVDGLPNTHGEDLTQALSEALTEKRLRLDIAFIKGEQRSIDTWLAHKNALERTCAEQRRWLTREQQDALLAARPKVDPVAIRSRVKKPGVATRLGPQKRAVERSLAAWEADHQSIWSELNAAHVERELVACSDLFNRVESKPLTSEQARAVVCLDNRVQVIASAGSGKTSTMIAKAAYAIHRNFVDPKRIILLAFNKQAAEELKERAAKAFERLGMVGVTVEASTFHALGLRIIGKATGEKPDIPDWATDAKGGIRKLSEIVDQLKDRSSTFRRQWDLFRFVFGRNLPAFGAPEPADVWDAKGNGALVTNRGERVKSLEEVMIANLLFLNGVNYVYEAPYPHRTADETYRQYRPDFYYPDLDLFHEHFALDANGVPPKHFAGYLEGVAWKRQLHKAQGTALFETTSHGLRHGDDLDKLENELSARGLVLDPNPDREIPKGGQKPMESAELIQLVRTFMSHAKSNSLSASDLQQKLDEMPEDTVKPRYQIFLDIALPLMAAWDEALAAEAGIDFEDMLNLAAEHLEKRHVESPYDLVMADEFQDASRARARLCRALVQDKGRFFFAVGDDWQSINRFAGADVSVMTGFREWFGHGQVLKLERSFRCPQTLCDVSSTFVSKNPAQITKRVHSDTPAHGPALQAFQADDKYQLAEAIDHFILRLADGVRDGTIPPGRNGKVSVYVLGRYNTDRQYVPTRQGRFSRWVDVSFLTIHRSKGSEADYIILPEMISVLRGRSFPNTRTDDPVLALAMPRNETFPLGEERRLFYVALTRARRTVAMFTVRGMRSTFLGELVEDGAVTLKNSDGNAVQEETCPACKQGALVMHAGPYGEFRSCSNFPICSFKPKRRGVTPPSDIKQDTYPRGFTATPPHPKNENHGAPKAKPEPKPKPKPETKATTTKWTLSSMLNSFLEGLEQVNRNVSLASDRQQATSELKDQIFMERTIIESALKRAHSNIKIEELKKDPRRKELFEQSYRELMGALAESKDKTPAQPRRDETPLPSFKRSQRHQDDEVEAAIQRAFDELQAEREAFLSVIHSQLSKDATLRRHFLEVLTSHGWNRYRSALDPASSWTNH